MGPWRARDRWLVTAGVDLTLVSPRTSDEGGLDVQVSGEESFVRLVSMYGSHPYRFLYGPLGLWRALRSAPTWDILDIHEEPGSLATAEVLVLAWVTRRQAPFLLYTAQNLGKRYPPPFRWVESWALRRAKAIYPCSEGAAEVISGKGARGLVQTIGLGVDLEVFRPDQYGVLSSPLRVGYVGRFLHHKGVHVLLEAMAATPDAVLELIGAGPEEAALTTQANRLGLAERVHFAGPCPPEKLPDRYRSFDVVVIPSVPTSAWLEQFCRVAVEAMASGVPVIASASGALPEVVGAGGILVPAGDARAIAAALADFAADRPERRQARRNDARTQAERFGWPTIAGAHLALYKTVAHRPNSQLWIVAPPGWEPDLRGSEILGRLAADCPGAAVGPLNRSRAVAGDVVWLLDATQLPGLPGRLQVLADPIGETDASPPLSAEHVVAWLKCLLDGQDLRSVAYLTHVAKPSGAELALLRQLPHVPGILPTIVVAEDGPLVARFRAAGLPTLVFPLSSRTKDMRRGGALRALAQPAALIDTARYTARLRKVLRGLGIDLVHTNSLKAAVYGPLAAKLARIPVVVHMRDRLAADYLGGPTAYLMRWWVRIMADAVLANSAATLATLGTDTQVKGICRAVVYDASVPPKGGQTVVPRSAFSVGMLGRLAPWKGQHVVVEAFALAFADQPQVRLRIAGGALFGEATYEKDLQEQIQRLGIADRVELLGHIDEIDDFFSSIDVLVHASVIPEPFGQVIIEGMAAGVVVVAADAGGPAEIIRDGVNGYLVRPGDPVTLAERLALCAAPTANLQAIIETGQSDAAQYAPDLLGPQIQTFYAKVDNRRRI